MVSRSGKSQRAIVYCFLPPSPQQPSTPLLPSHLWRHQVRSCILVKSLDIDSQNQERGKTFRPDSISSIPRILTHPFYTMTQSAPGHVNGFTQPAVVNGEDHGAAMPIAIIGMACRLAGTATSPQRLWQMLTRGQSGWSRGDNSRFKMDSFYHPSKEMKGAVC